MAEVSSHPLLVSCLDGSLVPCEKAGVDCSRFAQGELVIHYPTRRVWQNLGGIGCESCELRPHIRRDDRDAFGNRDLSDGANDAAPMREIPLADILLAEKALSIINS